MTEDPNNTSGMRSFVKYRFSEHARKVWRDDFPAAFYHLHVGKPGGVGKGLGLFYRFYVRQFPFYLTTTVGVLLRLLKTAFVSLGEAIIWMPMTALHFLVHLGAALLGRLTIRPSKLEVIKYINREQDRILKEMAGQGIDGSPFFAKVTEISDEEYEALLRHWFGDR